MTDRLVGIFPGLAISAFRRTSPSDSTYNCIAWAAGQTDAWWWPAADPRRAYWPSVAPREPTLEAFRQAFASIGFVPCPDADWEDGFEKVAIFVDSSAVPTHAARQLPDRRWTSKLGLSEDIEHELDALQGNLYGMVALIMKRPLGNSVSP